MYRDGATRAPMKWWGWGEESISFTHEGKPELAPFIERHLELDVRRPGTRPIAFGDLEVPPSVLPAGLRSDLEDAVGAGHVSTDEHDRVVHARGKSLTDLVRQRRGDLGRVADVVVRPATEERGGGGGRGGSRGGRGRDPVRRRDEHLRQPRAGAGRDAPGDLDRHEPHESRAFGRRHIAACARPGGRLRPELGAPAERPGLDLRALPRQLHPLDAGRLDRDALVGHAVRPLRRRGGADTRAEGRDPLRGPRRAPGAEHLDRPERARDGAWERGPARHHHRGDDPSPPSAARAHDPGLPLPHLGGRPRRDARHRGERGLTLGHARV